ncbi:uncharacterized protein TNCV_3242401 [Trichonephila clavipes]|nr:uncharacterized protein TNCV_3242401 [Trichonephila clavipes]
MLYWIQVRCVGWPIHTGDILRLKAFVNVSFVIEGNVCTVRTGFVIHKQKFSSHGASKLRYMLFQNNVPIDVACHRNTLNMQVSSGTKNNSSPNKSSCTTVTVSFNGILGGNGYLVVSILKSGENQTANKTWTRRKTSHKTTVVVSTTHALYSILMAGDSELR